MILFLDTVFLRKCCDSAEGKHKETELGKCLTKNTKDGAEIYHIKSSKRERKKTDSVASQI